MEEKNLSKVFWTEALTGGLVIGVLLFVWDLIGYWLNMPLNGSGIASFVRFVILAGGIVVFCRRIRAFRGPELGLSYGTAFGFILAMMLFTGIVAGIGQFFLQVVIAPDYFDEVYEMTLLNAAIPENLVEQMLALRPMMKNPVVMILSGIFNYVIYGGLIGLIAAAFLKRPADPFANNSSEDYNPGF